jgi:hypothetical protein
METMIALMEGWQAAAGLGLLVLAIFGGGGCLWFGGRYLAGKTTLSYQEALITAVLCWLILLGALFLGGTAGRILSDWLGTAGLAMGLIGAVVLAAVISWQIVRYRLKLSDHQAVVAWLPLGLMAVLLATPPAVTSLSRASLSDVQLNRDLCRMSMATIGDGLGHYYSHYGEFPPTLDVLVRKGIITAKMKHCPATGGAYLYNPACQAGQNHSYLLADPMNAHDSSRNVLYGDGRTECISETDFQKLLRTPPRGASVSRPQ